MSDSEIKAEITRRFAHALANQTEAITKLRGEIERLRKALSLVGDRLESALGPVIDETSGAIEWVNETLAIIDKAVGDE